MQARQTRVAVQQGEAMLMLNRPGKSAALVAGAVLASLAVASAADAASPLFDKAVKVVRVPLPRDPQNPQAKARVSCFYYPTVMVKEIDLGEKGAEQLSIVPNAGGAPACQRAQAADEKVIADWSGYFKGVKGGYVFFDADDGWNDGVGFAIFAAADGKKVFEDVTRKLHAVDAAAGGITLRYLRVYGATCSLAADKAACWAQIKRDTGLAGASPPDCAGAYKREQERIPAMAQQALADPTVIDYEATAALTADAQKITPVSGKAIACRPAE
jgi:hypothetical protein